MWIRQTEELVGEIWDETDVVEKGVNEISENQYVIDGDLPVSELIDLMDWDEAEFDYESETAGGWCIEMLDEFPDEGESFTYQDTTVKVLEVEERRVTKIQLLKKEKQEEK